MCIRPAARQLLATPYGLWRHGYSRDARPARPQLVVGLLCAPDGCPVAVEVFEGNTADPKTLSAQIAKLKQRFKLQHVVMVGDARHDHQRAHRAGTASGRSRLITALRAPAIKDLAE